MEDLIETVENLKKSKIKAVIDARIREFDELGKRSSREIFKELCFCILTANFNAKRSIMIQKKIGDGFHNLPEHELAKNLRELGHRYPKVRAKYIAEARRYKDSLKSILDSFDVDRDLNVKQTVSLPREWVVKNVKGIGYKEASHFLRNIGYKNLAIIDFHIIDLLVRHKLIERPKTLTKRRYIAIEGVLSTIAERSDLNLAELDLYLWFSETGKVLK